MEDYNLRKTVMDELEWDPSIEAAHIGVTANAGVVTLSGKVDSYAAKLAAERIAGRISGVKAVAEELEVEYPFSLKEGDDHIAQRAVQVLSWNVIVPGDRLKVKVENGWVTLSGELDWNYQRTEAEKDVRKLHGVKSVINTITIKPRVAPADVRDKIKAALSRNAQIEADNIAIVADGGKVILSGNVPRWSDRYTAEHAAWSAPGVMEVEDRLTVA